MRPRRLDRPATRVKYSFGDLVGRAVSFAAAGFLVPATRKPAAAKLTALPTRSPNEYFTLVAGRSRRRGRICRWRSGEVKAPKGRAQVSRLRQCLHGARLDHVRGPAVSG